MRQKSTFPLVRIGFKRSKRISKVCSYGFESRPGHTDEPDQMPTGRVGRSVAPMHGYGPDGLWFRPMTHHRLGWGLRAGLAVMLGVVGLLPAGFVSPLPATAATSNYVALTPARLLDTRPTNPVVAGGSIDVAVLGHGGVPASGVAAVFVNVTVVSPATDGFLTAWPKGLPQPTASTLNFTSAATIANGALVRVGSNGAISLSVSATTHVLVDVQGYVPSDSTIVSTPPARLLDT